MLRKLVLHRFKSWRKVEIEFGQLTALFGANSSGKSSLIQFLLMLKQTKDSADRSLALDFGGPKAPADLGYFRDAVHKNDESVSIEWNLTWDLPEEVRISDPAGKRGEATFRGRTISIESAVSQRGKIPSGDFLTYYFGGARFKLHREERQNFQLTAESTSFRFVRTIGRPWDLPGPTKSYAFPDQARTYFQNSQFLSEFETAYVRQMDKLLHLGPLRESPRRQYTWAGTSPIDVGRSGELTIDAILAATARGEKRNAKPRSKRRPFQEMIALALRDMGLIKSFHVDEVAPGSGLYRAWVQRDPKSPHTPITDVGFGISQVLPAVVLLQYAPEGSTIIMEQPEIHLHPSVQASLADLVIAAMKTRNLQVIVESHSEHFLHRLLRRIAEGRDSGLPEVSVDDVRMYFCKQEGGESLLERLRVNLYGAIENWPNDFFGDILEDAAAREEASLKRRRGH